jgi:hypothetical protein
MARRRTKGQTTQWPKEGQKDKHLNGQKKDKRTNNSMAKRRTKGQTTQWPKEEGQKDKHLNGQKKDKRTNTSMAKRRRTKGQPTIYEASHSNTNPNKKNRGKLSTFILTTVKTGLQKYHDTRFSRGDVNK